MRRDRTIHRQRIPQIPLHHINIDPREPFVVWFQIEYNDIITSLR
jgi:hypothetical protein